MRSTPPKVLKGDPVMMRRQIDAVPFRWKYSSGALSFAQKDTPTDAQLAELIEEFEELAFAGLPLSSRSILWVLHEERGRKDLHFVVPRQEVHSGKSYNAFPPGGEKKFDYLRDKFNFKYGWARAWQPDVNALIQKDAKRKNKIIPQSISSKVTDHIGNLALRGKIATRADIIREIVALGYSIPRAGKDYITVLDTTTGKRERLRGTLYLANFNGTVWLQGEKNAIKRECNPIRELNPAKSAEADTALQQAILTTAAYNRKRYQLMEICDTQQNIEQTVDVPTTARTLLQPASSRSLHLENKNDNWSLPKTTYSIHQKTLIHESLPIVKKMTSQGYGTRNIQYELSKINAQLRVFPSSRPINGKHQDMYIVRDKVKVPLDALGRTVDNHFLYSKQILAELDYRRWHQHDSAAFWFTQLIRLQEEGNYTAFYHCYKGAPNKKPKAQYLVDIHPELSCPIQLYQAIKVFFCQKPEHFPAWLSLQRIRRINDGLSTAVINDNFIKDLYPNISGWRLMITLPLIKTVQRIDSIINPDIPVSKKYKMTIAQEMDIDRKLRRFDTT